MMNGCSMCRSSAPTEAPICCAERTEAGSPPEAATMPDRIASSLLRSVVIVIDPKGDADLLKRLDAEGEGSPADLFITAGQVSDYIGARALLSGLPNVEWLLGDRGYDADWLREALQDKGIRACIPGRKQRKMPVKYDKRRYKRRNRIEIMFGRIKDWRRVATRYDRCPKVFLSAIALAALVIYWL